ncbi:unnamed protein product, partial [Mesorhabditis belari]|uniref:Palmitoyltransferase n=1 Tax=Mesorhabditis belari TaxID=2138241 RepID=A0AAF3FJN5_9BILA
MFVIFQLWANVVAIQSESYKNCPTYQLNRRLFSGKQSAQSFGRKKRLFDGRITISEVHPLRSIRCDLCGRCSLRNERHCYVLGTCIGVANFRYYAAFMIYLAVLCAYSLTWIISYHWRLKIEYIFPSSIGRLTRVLSQIGHMRMVVGEIFHQMYFQYERVVAYKKPIYFTFSCFIFAAMGLFVALCLIIEMVYDIYHGIAVRERPYLSLKIKGDDDRTSFGERLRFLFGKSFPLGLRWPRRWEDVDWSESFIETLLLKALLDDDEKTKKKNDAINETILDTGNINFVNKSSNIQFETDALK